MGTSLAQLGELGDVVFFFVVIFPSHFNCLSLFFIIICSF